MKWKVGNIFKNLKVRTKIIILAVFMLLVTVWMSVLALNNQIDSSKEGIARLEQSIRTSYDTNIKNQVENAITLINTFIPSSKLENIRRKRLNYWLPIWSVS